VAQVQVDLHELPADQQELRGSVMNGFNFTEPVRTMLARARKEAVALGHEYVGTEHVLLALVSPPSPVIAKLLAERSVDPTQVRNRIDAVVRRGRAMERGDLPYTTGAKHILEHAMSEARELGSDSVNTGHLFIGMIREGKGIAAQTLFGLGFTLDAVRQQFMTLAVDAQSEQLPPRDTLGALPSSGEMHFMAAVQALAAMAQSPRIAAVFEQHGVKVHEIIRDLVRLNRPG
jgi:ATP-dependent Clp protease ATP-binding subunit ClpA